MSKRSEKIGPKRWRIIIWDNGIIRPGNWQYNTEAEATKQLLSWDRCTGTDNRPVYAIGVVPMYIGQKTLRRHQLVHAFEKLLVQMQRDRLDLLKSLENAEKWVPQEDEPNLD